MDCFIKKIFINKEDEKVHAQFIRFGKGLYSGRAALTLMKTSKIKLKGGYEYANDFVNFVANYAAKFSGIVLSKEKLNLENEKMKSGKYHYETSLDSEKVREISEKSYYLLLDAEGSGLNLKVKKKLPKPGKGDSKIDDGFCVLEADLKYWSELKDAFLWDLPDCKKCKIFHEYWITSLELPKGEKDFAKIRLLTKRKGKIKRKIEIDGNKTEKEKEFEV